MVTIYISDLVSSEGDNPESETGDTAEPGELDDYLLLNISCSRLHTNISLPTTIDKLPQDASGWPRYCRVTPLSVGDTVTLHWHWELPIETDNDAQGDSLSFTINYMLEELPAPPSEEVPPPPAPPPGTTDVSDIVTTDGIFTEEAVAESFDKLCHLTITEGTKGLTKEKEPLSQITMVEAEEPLAPPEDAYIIGLVYDFGPDGATFEPPITLTITYDPSLIPEGVAEENLVIAYYNEDSRQWIELDSVVNSEANIVSAKVSHFAAFAVFGYEIVVPPVVPPVIPAAFTVSDLTISPSEVYISERVSIRVIVANIGGESGSYKVILKINGVVEATREVTINAGFSKEVTFSTTRDIAGTYLVEVDGLTGSFTVKEKSVIPVIPPEIPPVVPKPINWPLIGGIIGGIIAVGLLVYFLVVRRGRA